MENNAHARVGTTLNDKYVLEALLGQGGMGSVYRARHRNGNKVAVKVLHPKFAEHATVRDRFLREGYIANKIDHPAAVRVLDDELTADGTAFLVMELLEGETLSQRMARQHGPLSTSEIVSFTLQLLDMLEVAHTKGIVHRDLKPDNLFITTEGTLKVLDFGIARLHEVGTPTETETGAMFGTPAFMAPEQALGHNREVDGQTDLWAVGATMFALLKGPQTDVETTAAAPDDETAVERGAVLVRERDPGLMSVIDRALVFEKGARWPSASAMRDALLLVEERRRAAGQSAPVPSGAPSRPGPTSPPSAPRGRALRVVAIVLSVSAIASVLSVAFDAKRSRVPLAPSASASSPTEVFAPAPMRPGGDVPTAAAVAHPSASSVMATLPMPLASADRPVANRPARSPSNASRDASVAPPSRVSASAAAIAPSAPPAPVVAPPNACDPPYFIDDAGRHNYKPGCLK